MLVSDWLKSALECGCCAGVIGVIGLFSFMLQRWNKMSKNIIFTINLVNLDFHKSEIFLFIFLLRAAVILGRCAKSSTGKWKYKELTFLFLLLLLISFKVFVLLCLAKGSHSPALVANLELCDRQDEHCALHFKTIWLIFQVGLSSFPVLVTKPAFPCQ